MNSGAIKVLGLAAVVLVLGAGAVAFGGCAGEDNTGTASGNSNTTGVSVIALPLLDQDPPTEFRTATFAFG